MVDEVQVVDREEQRLVVLMEDRGRLWLVPMIEEPDDRDLPNGPREVTAASASVEGGSLEGLRSLAQREPIMAVASFTSVGPEVGEGPVVLDRTRETEPARNAEIDAARVQVAFETARVVGAERGLDVPARKAPVSMGKGPDHGSSGEEPAFMPHRGADQGR